MDTKQDLKVKALENALSRTEDIINMFSNVVRKDYDNKPAKHDFHDTASKILKPEKSHDDISFDGKLSDVSLSDSRLSYEKPEAKDERYNLSLDRLKQDAYGCTRCRLCSARTNVVFGEGCENKPTVMVIGEGPGANEDLTGRPFVGDAGKFLDQWLASISLFREKNCYISNIVKCRPPQNRDPQLDERTICKPFIDQQIALIKPRAILCLGRPASSIMTGKLEASMGELRGQFSMYDGIPMLCTYHPAAVLRDVSLKRPVWEDLKKLAKFLNLDTVSR